MYVGWRWVEWVHVSSTASLRSSTVSRRVASVRLTSELIDPASLFPQMIANGILFIVELFFFKETRGAKILAVRAKALRKETKDESYVHFRFGEVQSSLGTAANSSYLPFNSGTDLPPILSPSPSRIFCRSRALAQSNSLSANRFCFALDFGLVWLGVLPSSSSPSFLSPSLGTTDGLRATLDFLTSGSFESSRSLFWISKAHHSFRRSSFRPTLLFLSSLIVGCVIGFVSGLWADRKYDAVQKENNGVAIPEYRLWGAMFFSPLLPVRPNFYSLQSSGEFEGGCW